MTDIVERLYEEERLHQDGLGFGLGPAGLCQEAAEEIERLRHRLIEAEAALWRVYPNTYTVGGNPDPFEGSGETYGDAYHRLREENKRLRVALGDIADIRLMFEGGMGVSKANLENTLSEVGTLARAALAAAQGDE